MDKEIGEIIQDRINRLEKEKKDLIQKNRTYKGMLQKQNKIIDAMADVICMLDTMNNYNTWNNDIQEVREYFEKMTKNKKEEIK